VAGDAAARPAAPAQGVVDAVLSASRALITVATKSLGAAEEEITIRRCTQRPACAGAETA
jgi:hypothetical protein